MRCLSNFSRPTGASSITSKLAACPSGGGIFLSSLHCRREGSLKKIPNRIALKTRIKLSVLIERRRAEGDITLVLSLGEEVTMYLYLYNTTYALYT